jgi:hypothetical protein
MSEGLGAAEWRKDAGMWVTRNSRGGVGDIPAQKVIKPVMPKTYSKIPFLHRNAQKWEGLT